VVGGLLFFIFYDDDDDDGLSSDIFSYTAYIYAELARDL
jgi:hypothetical protein